MKTASTDWKETVSADEKERFARQATLIRDAHAQKNAALGPGRFLHRKALFSASGTLTVLPGLPEAARHGLFALEGTHPAVVRLSHGSFDVRANTRPDIRGFALKVTGLSGPSSLGGTTDHQDFLMINHDAFASRTSDEFLEITTTVATKGEWGLLGLLVRRYGLGSALKRLQLLLATMSKPFAGYNAEVFSTAVPVALGPYAGKVRLRPLAPVRMVGKDTGLDIAGQVARGPLVYEVAVQFYTDEATTPIENPPVRWPESESPFVPVARLTLTKAEADLEALKFDPWGGLADHRPLGEIMRSRKGAYYESQKARGVL